MVRQDDVSTLVLFIDGKADSKFPLLIISRTCGRSLSLPLGSEKLCLLFSAMNHKLDQILLGIDSCVKSFNPIKGWVDEDLAWSRKATKSGIISAEMQSRREGNSSISEQIIFSSLNIHISWTLLVRLYAIHFSLHPELNVWIARSLGGKTFWVNKEEPSSKLKPLFDYVYKGDCDAIAHLYNLEPRPHRLTYDRLCDYDDRLTDVLVDHVRF